MLFTSLFNRHSFGTFSLTWGAVCLALMAQTVQAAPPPTAQPTPIRHVVLISIDGLHEFDMTRFIHDHPKSALAQLARQGVQYRQSFTPAPADSFPGLMALVTGGTPGQTGVFYDVSYDRALSPAGSDCHTTGAVAAFDEKVDRPGVDGGLPTIDPALLPRDPRRDCAPVYPHQYLRVNTVFNVIHAAGGYTAWTDKHPVYEIVNGPDGHGVDDLYTPEIGADAEGNLSAGEDKITASIHRTEAYDDGKMTAVLNELSGRTHDGSRAAPVPMLTGLNLQAVNVGQKTAGYRNAQGQPTPGLEGAIAHCDFELQRLRDTLAQQHLTQSTLVIVAAKHGNGPVAPGTVRRIDRTKLEAVIDHAAPEQTAQLTVDRGALLWLKSPADLPAVRAALLRHQAELGIDSILSGAALAQHFGVSIHDARLPDVMIKTGAGVIYVKPGDQKLAEHGGWRANDRHVALLIASPALANPGRVIHTSVSNTQVAPTILWSLGLPPAQLEAVAAGHVAPLPGLRWVSALHS